MRDPGIETGSEKGSSDAEFLTFAWHLTKESDIVLETS
jgi:hypothetical protein